MRFYDFSKFDFGDEELLGKGVSVLVMERKGDMLRMIVSDLGKHRLVFTLPQREITEQTGYTPNEVERIFDTLEDARQELIDLIKSADGRS